MTINGSVHDENSTISQQSIQQKQSSLQQQQYISETASQDQFQQENEPNSQQQQQSIKTEVHTSEDVHQEQESEQNYVISSAGSDTDNQSSSQNMSNSGPKTYANLVKSFPSAGTSPQVSKSQVSISPVSIFANL